MYKPHIKRLKYEIMTVAIISPITFGTALKQKTCNIEILCVYKFYVVPHGHEIIYLDTIFDWTGGMVNIYNIIMYI